MEKEGYLEKGEEKRVNWASIVRQVGKVRLIVDNVALHIKENRILCPV